MFRLQRSEQCLFGTQDLDRRSGVFGQVHQASRVADEPCSDQFTNQSRQVRCDSLHSVPQVVGKLDSVLGDGDDLVAKRVNV